MVRRRGERPETGRDRSRTSPRPVEHLRWIWGYWRPHRGFLFFLFVFTLVSSAVTIAYPMVFKVVLDRILGAASANGAGGALAATGERSISIPPETIRTALMILGAIALGRFVAGFYPSFRAWMNLKIDVDVRASVFSRILRKDYRFFNRFAPGDLVTRLMDDISEFPKIAWFSCSGIFRGVDSASRLVFCVGAMFLLDARLALLSLLPLPVMMYIIYRVKTQLTEAAQAQQKAISQTNDMLEKTFSGIRIVKAFRAESGQSRALAGILGHRIGVQFRVQRLWGLITTLDTVASRVGQLVVLTVGGAMAVQGQVTLGTLYAFYIYLDMLVQPMWDLPNLVVTGRQAFVSIDREEEVIRFPVKISHPVGGERIGTLQELGFDRVTFRYEENAPPALDGVSFRARRGETVAVVGPVASGKSTLLKLTAGLAQPEEGEIRVNGAPLSHWRFEDYRRRVGYTPQDSILFSHSIRENVEMGREVTPPADWNEAGTHGHGGGGRRIPVNTGTGRPSRPGGEGETLPVEGDRGTGSDLARWVQEALRVAQMEDDLKAMTAGLDTVLGQKGSKVSGGQRQRISIARAIYGVPELLLLDDCTASLDAENEDRLWHGLRLLFPDATILLVSHRLATIRRAGRILVLDGGRLVDEGTHEELSTGSPVYRRFLERAEEREMVKTAEPPAGASLERS